MKHLRRTLLKALVLPLLLTAWACRDSSGPTSPLDVPVASSVVVDFQAGDGDQFLFLPPLAGGKPSAALATGLDLSVTICDPSAACETVAAKEEDDHYQVNWKTDKAKDGVTYGISVHGSGLLSAVVLGRLTVTLEKKGKEKAGSTLPIKFWVGPVLATAVEEISACVGDDRCNAASVPSDATSPTTLVTKDENDVTMGQVTFPPGSVPAGGLIVTLDCRQGGYAAGDGPLPTDLDQWPLFCHVDVKNSDGSAFTGVLTSDASIEICVVDEFEAGQGPYHGFVDRDDLVLGKSSDGVDFEFLPPGPESLSCEGATTQTASASPVGRIFDAIGSRLARVLSPVMPKKLYARRMMFRDGGVGGLVSSFSDINPVQPAVIEGTVTYGGVGVAGVSVTLSGDASNSTITDAAGKYSFGPLQAAENGGSSYTVAVSNLPAGQSAVVASQVVSVGGSGTFAADFHTVTPGLFYNSATGNYYEAQATRLSWPDAKTAAEGMSVGVCGGHLATITSAAENAFIVTNMPQAIVAAVGSGLGGGYWIGGFQPDGVADGPLEPAGGWEWVTGEPFSSYVNWSIATGEPTNFPGEHTLQFIGDWNTPEASAWNDEPGDRLYGYVVEYECPTP